MRCQVTLFFSATILVVNLLSMRGALHMAWTTWSELEFTHQTVQPRNETPAVRETDLHKDLTNIKLPQHSDIQRRDAQDEALDRSFEKQAGTTQGDVDASKRRMVYSRLRRDRSGASVQDILMANAYVFRLNKGQSSHRYEYGGACGRDINKRKPTVERLLGLVGLKETLPITCPKDSNGEPYIPKPTKELNITTRIVPQFVYYADDTRILTNDYLRSLGKSMKSTAHHKRNRTDGRKRIVVHIRRGDVGPSAHYLPNSHYLTLLDKYIGKLRNETGQDPHVVIYSESKSHESFDAFRERGYELRLDGPLEEVWTDMIYESDLFIMAVSSFSLTPAILRTALSLAEGTDDHRNIVYTPYGHKPLEGWDVQGMDLVEKSRLEIQRLKDTLPHSAAST